MFLITLEPCNLELTLLIRRTNVGENGTGKNGMFSKVGENGTGKNCTNWKGGEYGTRERIGKVRHLM